MLILSSHLLTYPSISLHISNIIIVRARRNIQISGGIWWGKYLDKILIILILHLNCKNRGVYSTPNSGVLSRWWAALTKYIFGVLSTPNCVMNTIM